MSDILTILDDDLNEETGSVRVIYDHPGKHGYYVMLLNKDGVSIDVYTHADAEEVSESMWFEWDELPEQFGLTS